MDGIGILRHAFLGGYRKKDVRNYIEELSKELNEKQTFYELKVAQLELEQTEQAEELESLRQACQTEQEKNAAALQRQQELLREKSALEAELAEQEERIRSLNNQLDMQMDDSAKTIAKIKSYQLKSEKYDTLNDQIGDIVLNAHSYANQVIESAKQEATALAIDSLENMSQLSTQVSGINQEISEVGGKVGDYVQQMNRLLSQLTEEIENAVRKIKPVHPSAPDAVETQGAVDSPPSIFDPVADENGKKLKVKVKLDEFPARFDDKSSNQGPVVLS